MKPYIVAGIFARGGSKGIPQKNIRLLAGKPLISYAINVALDCELINEVFVSTDNPGIAEIAKTYGAKVPFLRPSELASDTSPELLSWKHAIEMLQARKDYPKIDVFVSIPTTSPLRNVKDIYSCIHVFLQSECDIVISVKEAGRNPYFNMVAHDEAGYAKIVIPHNTKCGITRRQDAPVVYDITTVAYVARPDYILTTESILCGRVKTAIIPNDRALDIDTEFDFRIAECMLKYKEYRKNVEI